jgi:PAS domain S-box-containing protein
MTDKSGQPHVKLLAPICKEESLVLKAIDAGGFGHWIIKDNQLIIWPGTEMQALFGHPEVVIELTPPEIDRISKFEGNGNFKDLINGLLSGKRKNIETELAIPVASQRVWIWVRGKVIDFFPDGTSLLVAGTFLNSYNFHHQVEQIKANEEKFQSIFNQSNQSFFINEIEPIGPGTFIEVNQKAIDDFGFQPAEFREMNFFDIIISDSFESIDQIKTSVLNRENLIIPLKGRRKSGQIIDIELNSKVILLDHRYVLLSIVRDISHSIETECDLNKARILVAESERLKAAFLENISHELRTPMNAIVGFSNLMSIEDLDRKTRMEYAEIITGNTQLLLRLINDILDVSKIESGMLKIIRKQVNINHIISNLQDVFKGELHRINKNYIGLKPITPKSLDDIYLVTDPVRLNQILNNLLYNAIKFTDKGYIEYGFYPQGNTMVFFVKDTGIGIVKEKQDVIFEHFRQANDEISSKNHGGTGLGLSISKKLVELLGGRIWLESQRYKGSTFFFTIPFVPGEIVVEKASSVNNLLDKKNLLLVCDDENEINLFGLYLFTRPVNLLVAHTAEEAIHLFSSNSSIHLALVNQALPDMDGLEAVLSYRSLNPQTRFVVFGHPLDDSLKRRAKASEIAVMDSITASESTFMKSLENLLN